MPAILKSRAYDTWLDPGNHNAAALGKILNSDLISELASYPVPKRAIAPHPDELGINEAVGKPRQTTFGWPDPNQSFPEKR